jgi:hypothetical protein
MLPEWLVHSAPPYVGPMTGLQQQFEDPEARRIFPPNDGKAHSAIAQIAPQVLID